MIYLDKTLKKPLYEQIYICIKEEILSGFLPALSTLPATRQLAADLKVSRNTVDAAYQQLVVEGYVTPLVGSGYTVNEIPRSLPQSEKPRPNGTGTRRTARSRVRYDFWFPLTEMQYFPLKAWRKALLDAMDRLDRRTEITYPDRMGDPALREALCGYLHRSRGVCCSPEQIFVSCGIQFNIELLLKLFDPQRCSVAIEDPGYYGVKNVLLANRFSLQPIPVEKDGLDTGCLSQTDAGLLYITPSHQFPTGTVLSIRKRLDILEWAEKSGAFVIEDDYDSELRYSSMPIPSLQSLDKYDRVIYIGTFSKSLSSSLRVSYMVLPDQLCDRYLKKCGGYLSQVPLLHQYALTGFITGGHYERHLNRLRGVFSKKHDAFLETIQRVFGDKMEVSADDAGLHFQVNVRSPLKQQELATRALKKSVRVYPTEPYYLDKSAIPPHHLLLGYGGLRDCEYEPALQLLYETWFDGKE